jgi:2-amino-4-hydroxy-6-hydroxymethyldihydropteridine diphosphokinase
VRAFLGLGSNLGDSRRLLRDALDALGDSVVAVSPVYETEPVGGPAGQQDYLNIVVELETDQTPRQLLDLCRRLEAAAGRVRDERWGPRTLDVDVLLVGELRVDEPDLVVPHPRMHERRFVMAPLADVAPELVPPDWQDRVAGSVRRVGKL